MYEPKTAAARQRRHYRLFKPALQQAERVAHLANRDVYVVYDGTQRESWHVNGLWADELTETYPNTAMVAAVLSPSGKIEKPWELIGDYVKSIIVTD